MFQQFFAARLKEKGVSPKKLSDITGITPSHIENLLHGDFVHMPSAPYFRGYLLRIGKVLEFSGEEWWERLRAGGAVRNSGKLDMLPKNRFLKQSPPKFLWALGAIVIVLIYLVFQAPRILGKPTLAITSPAQTPFTTEANIFTLEGTVRNADSLSLNGDPITIAPDGRWQKGVLLQNGLNSFQLSAKKFLGGQTDVVEQILYQPVNQPGSTASSSASSTGPAVHFQQNTPATGTFYE